MPNNIIMADAKGGKPNHQSGVIILDDLNTDSIDIPVKIGEYTAVMVQLELIKTGQYINGEIVFDDEPTLHYSQIAGQRATFGGKYDFTAKAYQGNNQMKSYNNGWYCYGSPSYNLTNVNINDNVSLIKENYIALNTQNAYREYCEQNYYAEYEWNVWWW